MRRYDVIACCLLLLSACNPAPQSPVTVYVPAEFEEEANAWLPDSGLAVTVIAADSSANTQLIVAKQDSPRADVLITDGVADIWSAAENGALRPIASEVLEPVPDAFKDPDGLWTSTAPRHITIGTAPGLEIMSVIDLQKLAAPELKGKVCLSSSVRADNRALIAMLIAEHGNRPAERIVRGWVRNLAAAPFASEGELLAALSSAVCTYGVISSAADASGVWRIELATRYYNIQGVGVARHAVNPEAAQRLVAWMLAQEPLEAPAPNSRNVGQAGWYDEEARLLAERAGYR